MTTVCLLKIRDSAWLIIDTSGHILGQVTQTAPETWEAKHLPLVVGPWVTRTGTSRDEAVRILAQTLDWEVAP